MIDWRRWAELGLEPNLPGQKVTAAALLRRGNEVCSVSVTFTSVFHICRRRQKAQLELNGTACGRILDPEPAPQKHTHVQHYTKTHSTHFPHTIREVYSHIFKMKLNLYLAILPQF